VKPGGTSTWPISRRNSCGAIPTIARAGTRRRSRAQKGKEEGWPGDGGSPFHFDPGRSALDAPALWRGDLASQVVVFDRAPPGVPGASPFGSRFALAADRLDETGRHLVIDAAGWRHRLWLRDATPDVPLVILLALTADPLRATAADAARRLLAGSSGLAVLSLHPSPFQRQRLMLLLRVLDAVLAGARNREIGTRIVYPRLVDTDARSWKASSERRRVQRLISEALRMMRGGYRSLLTGSQT
jgi:hypothetical protein